ncbi:condensation domain-containing protein, partial [Puia sp.]|uniref:condensation domain-containing protein n=1 Tax=Puia sp. TaxID=2045100 RepID=UPI002F3FF014
MLNKVIDLLATAGRKGIDIVLNDSGLQIRIPADKGIDDALLEQIKQNKSLIIDYLRNDKLKPNRYGLESMPIVPVDRDTVGAIPLSFAQERLWFIHRLQGSVQYHIPLVLRIGGPLDLKLLERTLRTIVERHEVLRTVIREQEGTGYQEVMDADGWSLGFEESATGEVDAQLREFLDKPFDLSFDYLFRACLYEIGAGDYLLATVFHHISSDGWSGNILVKEFVELYNSYSRGATPALRPLPVQYRDYA